MYLTKFTPGNMTRCDIFVVLSVEPEHQEKLRMHSCKESLWNFLSSEMEVTLRRLFIITRGFVAFYNKIFNYCLAKITCILPPRYLKFQRILNKRINPTIISSYVSGQTAGNESQTLHFHNQCSIW